MLSKADVKYINSLQNKKYRKIERAFLVEGLKNVEELLKSDYKIKRLFCTESYAKTFSKSFAQIEVLSANELTKLGTLENNTTALAVAEIKELANLIANEVGYSGALEFDTTKPDGTQRKLLDTTKINNLGWKPSIQLIDGIKQTLKEVINKF